MEVRLRSGAMVPGRDRSRLPPHRGRKLPRKLRSEYVFRQFRKSKYQFGARPVGSPGWTLSRVPSVHGAPRWPGRPPPNWAEGLRATGARGTDARYRSGHDSRSVVLLSRHGARPAAARALARRSGERRSARRHQDRVWRVRFRDRWLYVLVLLEFQSAVDRTMAVPSSPIHQDLLRASSGPLPPVLPIVIYDGSERWTAAKDVAGLGDARRAPRAISAVAAVLPARRPRLY